MILDLISQNQVGKWITATDHTIVCTTFTPERHRLFANSLIDNSIGEHGLIGDTKDKCSEASVITWLGLFPHTSGVNVNFSHSIKRLQLAARGVLPSMTALTLVIASTTIFSPASKARESFVWHA
jgi:hypothetical protein